MTHARDLVTSTTAIMLAAAGLLAAPATAAVYVVNPAYPPGVNGTYTQFSAGPTGNYGVELRGANNAINGDWEIGVGSRTSVNNFFNQGQLSWGCGASGPQGCGTVFNFTLNWTPSALSISLTPQGGSTTTVVTPVSGSPGFAPLVGDTLRVWAKRDASFTITEVDGRSFNISGNGDLSGVNGGALPGGDYYFYSPDNWGGNGLIARGTLRIKGGGGSAREIFFANGDFDPSAPYPEPATWMLMITGFGAVGTAMRRRRTAPVRTA